VYVWWSQIDDRLWEARCDAYGRLAEATREQLEQAVAVHAAERHPMAFRPSDATDDDK
jgi:hypothetical protein